MPDLDMFLAKSPNDPAVLEIAVSPNPKAVSGNKAMANRFQIILLTDGNGPLCEYGGSAIRILPSINSADGATAMLQHICDGVVVTMKSDDASNTPATEKIVSAKVKSVTKSGENISAKIELVPQEYDSDAIILSIPFGG